MQVSGLEFGATSIVFADQKSGLTSVFRSKSACSVRETDWLIAMVLVCCLHRAMAKIQSMPQLTACNTPSEVGPF